ncbi:MAG: CoA-binding protein [Bacteroidetes bacterium]|nr:CoA-binding protein [Bacteroidota bacterium]
MSIIFDENTNVLVQGMTGKEGQRSTESMLESGVKVSAGVTPGKGGQKVLDKPIFNTVAEALEHYSSINLSVLYVPPLAVLAAAMEAMDAGIKTLIIIAENVPVKDSALILEHARNNDCRIIGPSSIGVLNTKLGKLGSIGKPQESKIFSPGKVGIISKSGGMCAETASILTQKGIGQSSIVGIGGDVIVGTNFVDVLKMFEQDEETKAVVIFGEVGGFYEHQIADMVKSKKFTKPVIAYISGQFVEKLGRSLALGHAGAIIEGDLTTARAKKKALKEAGVLVADYHYQIPELVQQVLK